MINEPVISNKELEIYNHRILDIILDLNQQVEDLEFKIEDLESELYQIHGTKKEEVNRELMEYKRIQITTINPIRRRLINLHDSYKNYLNKGEKVKWIQ